MWFQGDREALSDTFRDIVKLNNGKYSKNQLCLSKFYMAHIYIYDIFEG